MKTATFNNFTLIYFINSLKHLEFHTSATEILLASTVTQNFNYKFVESNRLLFLVLFVNYMCYCKLKIDVQFQSNAVHKLSLDLCYNPNKLICTNLDQEFLSSVYTEDHNYFTWNIYFLVIHNPEL